MNRNFLNWCVDGCLALVGLGLLLTGLLMWWVLSPGSREATVWTLTRHDWGDVHFWFAAVAVGLVLIHLFMHWGWVVIVTAKTLGRRSKQPITWGRPLAGAVSAAVLVFVVVGFIAAATWSVVPGDRSRGPGRGWGQHDHDARVTPIADRTRPASRE